MNKKVVGIILAIIAIVGGFLWLTRPNPKNIVLGTQHKEQGREHIGAGQKHAAYNSDPASSGPHYADNTAPTPWGVYTQEVPEEVFVHNEEHGGVIITYRPDIPTDQLKKLQALFAPPYSNKSFTPSKAIVTPRTKNTQPIELASWNWTLSLDRYDEAVISKFYRQHVSKSPEATAGPNNTPINQAAN